MVPGRIEVYRRKGWRRKRGGWDWRLVAANGNILCGSDQGYSNKQDAVNMATTIVGGTFYAASTWHIEGETQ